jgi:hypothetical protein
MITVSKNYTILSLSAIRLTFNHFWQPLPPKITGLPKVHIERTSIGHLINFKEAPAYLLAKNHSTRCNTLISYNLLYDTYAGMTLMVSYLRGLQSNYSTNTK